MLPKLVVLDCCLDSRELLLHSLVLLRQPGDIVVIRHQLLKDNPQDLHPLPHHHARPKPRLTKPLGLGPPLKLPLLLELISDLTEDGQRLVANSDLLDDGPTRVIRLLEEGRIPLHLHNSLVSHLVGLHPEDGITQAPPVWGLIPQGHSRASKPWACSCVPPVGRAAPLPAYSAYGVGVCVRRTGPRSCGCVGRRGRARGGPGAS
mmetsp:Transcript_42056/g.82274  ORF Transcript_42056/g.82274 Transcript_42056/m.82274 type:complete len:205 (+) Transcript_42056:879-1493(+)